jgi:hypothetical protein
MVYTPKTSSKFNRTKKKLPGNLRNAIDDQVRLICEDPSLGVLKIGDLADVRVHKFGFLGRLYLLAYEVDEGAKINSPMAYVSSSPTSSTARA